MLTRTFRTKLSAVGLASVVVAAGVVMTPAAAHAAPIAVNQATLAWGVNAETQSAPPSGGCNYLSAGQSDGTQSTYAAVAGNVAIVKSGATPTWANHCTLPGGNANQLFVFYNGAGTVDPVTGATTIQWFGNVSVNYYGGALPFWFTNPVLTVNASGTGQLTADMGGYASSQMNPGVKVPIPTVQDVVIANVSGVNGKNSVGFSVTPKYAGVIYNAPGGNTPQNRTTPGWGAWPTSFVNFQNDTGLSSYWYSSGSATDARKPPSAFSVGYGLPPTAPAAPTAIVAKSSSTKAATGSLTVAFTGGSNNGAAIQSHTATCTSSNGGGTKTGTRAGAAGAITVKAVKTGKSYACKVRATNAVGVGAASVASLPVIVGSPAPPTAAKAVRAAARKIKVTFKIGANNGAPIQSQTASCVSTNGGAAKSGTHKGATAGPITVSGLSAGKTYKCSVRAKNARGLGLASGASNAAKA